MSQSLEQGKRKLTAKDAITAGALGAVCIAIRFVFMLVGGVSPYVWFATHFMDTMEGLLTWPVFGIIVLSILVGSILGALLGMKLMRKHFVKAGLAQ